MKILTGILGSTVAISSGYQAIIISKIGVINQIPQLEGDGGAGMLFALLCFVATVLCFIKPIFSITIFVLAALVSIFTGFIYDDTAMYVWSAAPLVLAFVSYLSWKRKNIRKAIPMLLSKKSKSKNVLNS